MHAIPDDTVVADIASELIAADFEVAPVLRKVLKSEHFYRSTVIGARIKSPVEFALGFLREVEVVPTQALWEELREVLSAINLGQELLNPPNVAGWTRTEPAGCNGNPGHHTWADDHTLPDRWTVASDGLYQRNGANYDPFELVSKVSDPSDPYRIAIDLATVLDPGSVVGNRNSRGFGAICRRPFAAAGLRGERTGA